jgi:hypothetical protein
MAAAALIGSLQSAFTLTNLLYVAAFPTLFWIAVYAGTNLYMLLMGPVNLTAPLKAQLLQFALGGGHVIVAAGVVGPADGDLTGLPSLLPELRVGRAWRWGTMGHAIGVSGMKALRDRRGETDLFGRVLVATLTGLADEIATAATLAMGEGAEGTPAALVRGVVWEPDEAADSKPLLRSAHEDLFP